MAPLDSQNCGREFAKREQTNADFAANSLLRMVIIDIESNTSVGRLTLDPAGMHCPSWDDAFVSSCSSLYCYQQDAAKRQTAGIVLLTGQKSGFSPRRGDSLHRFRSNFAVPTGTGVRLAVQNFTSISADGWECGPQNIKNFPVGATPLTDFRNF